MENFGIGSWLQRRRPKSGTKTAVIAGDTGAQLRTARGPFRPARERLPGPRRGQGRQGGLPGRKRSVLPGDPLRRRPGRGGLRPAEHPAGSARNPVPAPGQRRRPAGPLRRRSRCSRNAARRRPRWVRGSSSTSRQCQPTSDTCPIGGPDGGADGGAAGGTAVEAFEAVVASGCGAGAGRARGPGRRRHDPLHLRNHRKPQRRAPDPRQHHVELHQRAGRFRLLLHRRGPDDLPDVPRGLPGHGRPAHAPEGRHRGPGGQVRSPPDAGADPAAPRHHHQRGAHHVPDAVRAPGLGRHGPQFVEQTDVRRVRGADAGPGGLRTARACGSPTATA